MTLAHKHKSTTSKIVKEMRRADGEWVRTVEHKEYRLYRLKTDHAEPQRTDWLVDYIPNTSAFTLSHTELERRLSAKVCEVCGSTKDVEVHHVRALKDIKNSKSLYDQMMIARRRKTLILCSLCHHKLHAGK
jgi:RNA-directed DNA polymerase